MPIHYTIKKFKKEVDFMKNSVKIIFHIDLNTFFCTVATLKNPSLKGKAFAIGRENTYRGVLSTASYEAREYGIHSGMSIRDAFMRKNDLIVVSVRRKDCQYYHNIFVNLLMEYSDSIEVASIDEAFLDVTERSKTMHPLEIAKEIQDRLLYEHELPCSIGIAPTLFLAKMGSDMKKPLGITVIRKREVEQVLFPLSVRDIYGIGKKTYPKLINAGIKTIGDFIDNKDQVIDLVGESIYAYTFDAIYGKSSNAVDGERHSINQSISTSSSYDFPLQTETDILFELRMMTKGLVQKLVKDDYYTKTIRVTFRNLEFKTYSKSISVDYTQDFYDIFLIVEEIVETFYRNEPLRLVGVELANLSVGLPVEYNLFTFHTFEQKEEALEIVLQEYIEKYGEDIIRKGVNKKE